MHSHPLYAVLAVGVAICTTTLGAQRLRPGDAEVAGRAVPRLRIGLDPTPSAASRYQQDDLAEAVQLMKRSGANHVHVAKVWSDIEPRAGSFDLGSLRFLIEQSAPLPVAFNLKVVDAGARKMAEEYRPLAWDSPAMIAALERAIDQLAEVLGSRPWSYAIGNEMELYLRSRPAEVAPYARMLERVRVRVRTRHPRASFTTAFEFRAGPRLKADYAPLLAALDHVTFNYYPLTANFTVRPETSFPADLEIMLAAAAPKPLYLQEIGYPTASLLGGSVERQRMFVQIVFETLRAVGPRRALGATYLFQADLPEWLIDLIAINYGASADAFRAYIGTLGLRDERNQPKPAWHEFVRQARMMRPNR